MQRDHRMGVNEDWDGANGAVLLGERLLTTLRDDYDWIPFPDHWDLVGGAREPGERPRETLIREAGEEVGLDLRPAEWLWENRFPSTKNPDRGSWFFVLRLPVEAEQHVVFGDKGQVWRLISPLEFLTLPRAVPSLQHQLRLWFASLPDGRF